MNRKLLKPEFCCAGESAEFGFIPLVPLAIAATIPLTAWWLTKKIPEPLPIEERVKAMPVWLKITIGAAAVTAVYVITKGAMKKI